MSYGDSDKLLSLQPPGGSVPNMRVQSAASAQDMLRQLLYNDANRSYKRSLVQGLYDGNPPKSSAKLRELGSKEINVNWMTSKAYCKAAEGIFFDLFSEAPTNFLIHTGFGTEDEKKEWGQVMSEEAHDVLNSDSRWQFTMSNSQHWMVLHGCGPMYFEDKYSVMPRWIPSGDLKVPDNSESDTSYWESCFILMNYKPAELYEFIKDSVAAQKVGWRVGYTRGVIVNAVPERQQQGITLDWEWYQRQFKQNSFSAYFDVDVVKLAHFFYREFDGSITHCIIEQDTQGGASPQSGQASGDEGGAVQYLYVNRGRFKNFGEVIHPMYWEQNHGKHYTVNGMGVDSYGPFVLENRLLNNLAEKAMSPKLLFKPTTPESQGKFSLIQLGDFGVIPAGFDFQQAAISGIMEDGIAMRRELSQTVSNNLANYMQGWQRSSGNPPTARQVMADTQKQYAIAGTQVARYYVQLDHFYAEVAKRMCNLNTTDPLAREFQKRCLDRGVNKAAFGRIRKVEANRVAGQGSASLRQAALNDIMTVLQRLPEKGQDNLIKAFIASRAGQRAVREYYPETKKDIMGTDQEERAMNQVTGMKIGVPPVITSDQSAVTFATVFLKTAGDALGSVPQGGNPIEVLKFVELAAPAALAHLNRFANDPTRTEIYKGLSEMWKTLASVTDQLKKSVQAMMEKQAQQQPNNGNQVPPEVQQKLAIQDAQGKLKLRQSAEKHQLRMAIDQQKAQQKLTEAQQRSQVEVAATDLRTAAEIRSNRLKSTQK